MVCLNTKVKDGILCGILKQLLSMATLLICLWLIKLAAWSIGVFTIASFHQAYHALTIN